MNRLIGVIASDTGLIVGLVVRILIHEPQCEKAYTLKCAPNEDTNQPVRPRSLIGVFVVSMMCCIHGDSKCECKIF